MTNPMGMSDNGGEGMLHVLQGAQQGRAFPLRAPEMDFGREGGAIDLGDYRQMSRRHARLFFENGAWNVQDFGSTNGTQVNGERVATRRLQDGDVLKMGDFSARVSLPYQAGSTPSLPRTEMVTDFDSPPTQLVPQAPQNFPPPQNPQYPWPQQNAPQYSPPQSPQHYPPQQNYPPQQYPPPPNYQVNNYHTTPGNSFTTGQTLGTVALCLMLVGLMPCLGWLNWFTILLGGAGAITSLVGLTTDQNPSSRNSAVTGLILSLVAVGIGGVRLALGGGVC